MTKTEQLANELVKQITGIINFLYWLNEPAIINW